MTSEHETETNLESRPAQPAGAEVAYDLLAAYGFARRYVKGKVVADVGGGSAGNGSRLLAETGVSVTAVNGLPEIVELASSFYDVVVAFGVIEDLQHPEDLLKEAKRILKEDGVLLVSALDKHTNTIERGNPPSSNGRGEMYVPDFQHMLERHFEHVRIYRQGAVAGGFVYPASKEPTGAPVEVARFSLSDPCFGVEPPRTRSVIAVCSDGAGVSGDEEEPYLLLDAERRVFEESVERAEDVELLHAEIRRMQETEVRALVEALRKEVVPLRILLRLASRVLITQVYGYWKANILAIFRRDRELTYDEARRRRELTFDEGRHRRNLVLEQVRHRCNKALEPIRHRRNIIRGNIYAIRKKGPRGMAQGAFRRSRGLYRRLRNKDESTESNQRSKYEREQRPPSQRYGACGPLQERLMLSWRRGTGEAGILNGDR